MLEVLDAAALRRWCRTALELLGRERERIDSLNVFPVADADTGTNLFLTVEAACEAVESGALTHPDDFAAALNDLAHGAFLGARGNSGVILSQILRGMAQAVNAVPAVPGVGGRLLGVAFAQAATAAYAAVAAPAEGTILTVVSDVADAVTRTRSDDLAEVVQLALSTATQSLARTPDQMALLRRHGVVDAGGAGLVVLLAALVQVVTDVVPTPAARSWETAATGAGHRAVPATAGGTEGARPSALGWPQRSDLPVPNGGPAAVEPGVDGSRWWADGHGPPLHGPAVAEPAAYSYEVMFLLEAPESALGELRSTLEPLGDSLLVVGGNDLWNVHVHVNDVGAVIEAGLAAGRPYRIRVSYLTTRAAAAEICADPSTRAVVLVVEGEGLAALAREAGATALAVEARAAATTPEVLAAIRARSPAEAIVIPAGERFRSVADAAAQEARNRGIRASVVPVRAAVQALAAIAVHDPTRRFDDDVVSMTAAAGATRCASVTIAERRAMTSAGVCEPGDVLGLVDGDVVVIADDARTAARDLVARLLGGGGELVTLIHGEDAAALATELCSELHAARPDIECLVYAAGTTSDVLLVGVE